MPSLSPPTAVSAVEEGGGGVGGDGGVIARARTRFGGGTAVDES